MLEERLNRMDIAMSAAPDLATIKIDLRPSGAKLGELGHRMAMDPPNPTANITKTE